MRQEKDKMTEKISQEKDIKGGGDGKEDTYTRLISERRTRMEKRNDEERNPLESLKEAQVGSSGRSWSERGRFIHLEQSAWGH